MEGCFNMGKIVNTHGVRGEVKVYPYSDDLEKFEDFEYFYIEGEGKKKYEIESTRVHKNMVLVKFKGYEDINKVLNFLNKNVYMERKDVEDDSEGHYIVDLIGCEIFDDQGALIGHLKDVLQTSAQDLYEIKKASDGKMFYLPVVDEFVKNIDIKNKKITVHLIEGIME
ncbi:MAG TPA: ribosome maturation factor RimM [Fusibacter sp.]|nr:ribosome maturation factor RimM [Fusibacter sp.]